MLRISPDLLNAFIIRHGNRERNPEQGFVWDPDAMCAEKYRAIALTTRKAYFGDRMPTVFATSPIKRAGQTLEWIFDVDSSKFVEEPDPRLGTTQAAIAAGVWNKIDEIPDTYDATALACYEADSPLMERCGKDGTTACIDAALEASLGSIAVLCSHFGNADMVVRMANELLGLFPENNFWLPGKGFETGGLAHLAWKPSAELVSCRYYPPVKV